MVDCVSVCGGGGGGDCDWVMIAPESCWHINTCEVKSFAFLQFAEVF